MKWVGNRVYIRFLEESDAQAILDLHMRNRDFFQHYLPDRDDAYFTLEAQLLNIRGEIEKRKQGELYAFGIFLNATNELIGKVTLSEILHAPHLRSCWIGYYLDQAHNGNGYMTEAVRLAVKFAFEELNLHRIEAGVMPHNIASIRVLEKAGFEKEGIARKNVKINGEWRDHQILAIINEND
ncbi:GNAT family N-acetyltransferase [Polycladomyces subterraneus]|uniref:GNAT family N-acetyltransferase n=1 Tax=Polycladomyces subterraneus TaxID=1016997 RepID=A0ABT8IPK1_9BACL|nr:GNAT family protein [Polycladomyces subterraneus]MDN4594711.1 GNAT family N-acetyltransferase [Polycladomyces subterraneus]